ncbi:sensor histidine kinase [Nafulsella turpanensis]|uniref:sensor histidine kinase n=1 Tax=Nafulsella turpanensis TaxID=1265690 RepID=UPI00034CBFB0|nr:histidine kinase [Nafulsella turpanensis]
METTTNYEVERVWRWLKWAYAISVSVFIYILQILMSLHGEPVELPLWGYILIFISLLLLWTLCEWIHHKLHVAKAKASIKLVLLQVVLSLAGSLLVYLLVYLLVRQGGKPIEGARELLEGEVVIVLLSIWMIFSCLTIIFLLGSYLIIHWKQSAVESQQLKKETALATYNALKSQINPHFIFNSLNTLHALIHEDPKGAAQFLEQLSEILRYTLQNRNSEVVPAREELAVTEAYLQLFKARFGKLFSYTIENNGQIDDFQIVSLTLPTLLENVFKHNVLSGEAPLLIKIRRENGYLIVENTKGAAKEAGHSLGVGLSNIRERYGLLGSEPVVVEDTASLFRVKIPLLHIMTYEDSNY